MSTDSKLICFDTETTGLDDAKDEILSIAIIDANGNTLLSSFVRPMHHRRWPDAERINHISPKMVADAPTMEELKPQIQDIFDQAEYIVGYNVWFDLGFLESSGIHVKEKNVIDVMRQYSGKGRWQKLTVCAEDLGYSWGEDVAHGSLADAKATLFCFYRLHSREMWKEARKQILDVTRYNWRSPITTVRDIRYLFYTENYMQIDKMGEKEALTQWVKKYYPEWYTNSDIPARRLENDGLKAAVSVLQTMFKNADESPTGLG